MSEPIVYVSDTEPGITRRRCGRGFSYVAPDGTTIARGPERRRIEALAVPPAYKDVWICALSHGHLQATGRDQKRRKQYRYHPDWQAVRAQTKFDELPEFGRCLPRIRRRVSQDLKSDVGSLQFALATAVSLIDRAALRVGHPDYTRHNGSYGALTLRDRHVETSGKNIALNFRAKGGKSVQKTVSDKSLQRALERIADLPGATLLTWIDDDGEGRHLSSQQLNAYLTDAGDFEGATAKTFRTWAGTLAAFERAEQGGASIKDLAEAAAKRLHNTPTVARQSYIHPSVIEMAGMEARDLERGGATGLRVAERRLMTVLEGA